MVTCAQELLALGYGIWATCGTATRLGGACLRCGLPFQAVRMCGPDCGR